METKRSRPYHNYTLEEVTYIKDAYADISAQKIADKLGVPKRSVYQIARRLGLRKSKEYISEVARINSSRADHPGIATRFKPGHVPFCKGKKQVEYCSPEGIAASARTRFKPGNRPANWKPLGSERTNIYGYREVKVKEGIRGWRQKHQVVWEEHHGEVPRGYRISFRDGNPLNCEIDNLYLVTVEVMMRRNTIHNYPDEIREIVHLRGVVTREINKQKRNRDEVRNR